MEHTYAKPPEHHGLRAAHAAVHALVDREKADAVEKVRSYLRLPGFSASGLGIRESAAATLEHLRRIGVRDAHLVETPGHPVVFGTLASSRPAAKTLILYGLYDLTPVVAEEWDVDPLGAEVVEAGAIGLPPALGQVICSRGAHNHRGPLLAALLGIEALLRAEGDLPCNLVFVIEGEEEVGSPSLSGFIDTHRAELSGAAGAWLPCMNEGSEGQMVLYRGFKGSLFTELACVGGEWGGTADGRHLWAGHSAWIDAPLMQLTRALASLLDDQDQLTLDDLDEFELDLSDEDRRDAEELKAAIRADPAVEAGMRRTLNISRLRGGAALDQLLERFMFGVNVNVQGIVGGYTGPGFYTMMPGAARARIDVRFPLGIDQHVIERLLRRHLDRRGFSHVDLVRSRGYPAARTHRDDPLLAAAASAAAAHGTSAQVWPMYNGCCPASLFQSLTPGLPFSFAGLGQGERPHAPNEFIRLDAVSRLMHFTVSYLHAWSATL